MVFHKNLNPSTGLYSYLQRLFTYSQILLFLGPFCLFMVLSGCSEQPFSTELSYMTLVPPSYQAVVKTPQPVILKFYTETCYDCQQIAPKLQHVVAQHPSIRLVAIDLQNASPQQKALAKDLGVVTVPHVLYVTSSGNITQKFLDNADEEVLMRAAQELLVAEKQPLLRKDTP